VRPGPVRGCSLRHTQSLTVHQLCLHLFSFIFTLTITLETLIKTNVVYDENTQIARNIRHPSPTSMTPLTPNPTTPQIVSLTSTPQQMDKSLGQCPPGKNRPPNPPSPGDTITPTSQPQSHHDRPRASLRVPARPCPAQMRTPRELHEKCNVGQTKRLMGHSAIRTIPTRVGKTPRL
jgi:hypothetical protein